MKIYNVIVQGVAKDGWHTNSITPYSTFEKAKDFVDSCVEGQKRIEGTDTMVSELDITGEPVRGWVVNEKKIVYGIEIRQRFKSLEEFTTRRFVIEDEVL